MLVLRNVRVFMRKSRSEETAKSEYFHMRFEEEWILMEKFLDQMWRDRKERDDRHIFYKTESRKK